MSSCSAWRWVTSAIGPPSATAALSAVTLFSRPTWSGTIISGKMTVSRSATSGSSTSWWWLRALVRVRRSLGIGISVSGWARAGASGGEVIGC